MKYLYCNVSQQYPDNMPCGHPRRDTEWDLDDRNLGCLEGQCLRCGTSLTLNLSGKYLTFNELEKLGGRARRKFNRPSGNCLKISTYIMTALHKRHIPARVNETSINGNRHYEVITVSNGQNKIRIDASRDQFKGYVEEIYIEYVKTTNV